MSNFGYEKTEKTAVRKIVKSNEEEFMTFVVEKEKKNPDGIDRDNVRTENNEGGKNSRL